MRHHLLLLPACALLLCGCGGDQPTVKETITAPLDQTQRNIEWANKTKKELKDTAKARSDEANKIIDERLKK